MPNYSVFVSGRPTPISVVGDGYNTNSQTGELYIYTSAGSGETRRHTPVATFASNGWQAITVKPSSAKAALSTTFKSTGFSIRELDDRESYLD